MNEEIKKANNSEANKGAEKLWSDFNKYFWIIFAIKVGIGYGYRSGYLQTLTPMTIFVIELLSVLAMVCIMGYYAYKISGDSKKMLVGVLGFLWFGVITIFIGYFMVKAEKNRMLEKKPGSEIKKRTENTKPLNEDGSQKKLSIKMDWKKITIVLLAILVAGGLFYWFQLRPGEIKKECLKLYPNAFMDNKICNSGSSFSDLVNGCNDIEDYKKCLIQKGL